MRDQLSSVSIVGIGQIPVQKKNPKSLRQMGAEAIHLAMESANIDTIDALFVGNMLADELQGQKHVATLIAGAAGLRGVEALHVRAATATGAAALRMAYFAVASGEARVAIALGVEKMSSGDASTALAKALDAETESSVGATLLGQNALLMKMYMGKYGVSADVFNEFSLTAHRNARTNPNALFKDKIVTEETIRDSRVIVPPLRLYDASPVCDGAAAVVLTRSEEARAYTHQPVKILGSSVATDTFRIADRENPLHLFAAKRASREAFRKANVHRSDLDFFELHDAFSIMSCLALEAVGFCKPGEGWKPAVEHQIGLDGTLPISTFGGLKARGHPVGASAIYQTCEIVQQLMGKAGANQVKDAKLAMLLSIGGAGSTALTHIFGI